MRPRDEALLLLTRLSTELEDDLAAARGRRTELEALLSQPTVWEAGDPHLAVAALGIHHLYSAVESALRRIALVFEGRLPEGTDWHRELLRASTVPLHGIRPAVVLRATARALDEPLRFRHFLRHAYAVVLEPDPLRRTALASVEAAMLAEADLSAFLSFLADCLGELAGAV